MPELLFPQFPYFSVFSYIGFLFLLFRSTQASTWRVILISFADIFLLKSLRIRSDLYFETIAHTPDRLNILRFRGVKLDLLANFLNVNRDCRNISDRLHIPDL